MSLLRQLILSDASDDGVLGASLPSWTAREHLFPPGLPVAASFELPVLFPRDPGGEIPSNPPTLDAFDIFDLFPPPAPSPGPEPAFFAIFEWLGWG